MKITKSQLKQIIKEELGKVLRENDERPVLDTMGYFAAVEMPDGKELGPEQMHAELMNSKAVVEYEGEKYDFGTEDFLRSEEYAHEHSSSVAEMYLIHKGYDPDDRASVARRPEF